MVTGAGLRNVIAAIALQVDGGKPERGFSERALEAGKEAMLATLPER
jgi:hypothetical protein